MWGRDEGSQLCGGFSSPVCSESQDALADKCSRSKAIQEQVCMGFEMGKVALEGESQLADGWEVVAGVRGSRGLKE